MIFETRPKSFARSSSLDSGKSEAWFKLGHEYLDLSARLAFRGARLQQFEPPADALAGVQGVTNENAEARYCLARTYQARGRDPIHNEG